MTDRLREAAQALVHAYALSNDETMTVYVHQSVLQEPAK